VSASQPQPANDWIEVTGEMARAFGATPPLDGRIDFGHGNVFRLTGYVGEGVQGRIPFTYIGRRVHEVSR
jgi:hypothetical protein